MRLMWCQHVMYAPGLLGRKLSPPLPPHQEKTLDSSDQNRGLGACTPGNSFPVLGFLGGTLAQEGLCW